MKINHNNYFQLAYNQAKINLGKTNQNPSVGCIVVKNNSVISSGVTSLGGRPHAEYNALIAKKNFKNSNLYLTMEPCTHYGLTPPCTNLIDKRTANKSKKILNKANIQVCRKKIKDINDFYKSYFLIHKDKIPFIDAKLAISKDYFTINKKKKWITNYQSRIRAHLLRSEYDAIISTSKSINKDNSLLNCRIKGLDNDKPNLFIIDLKLKIRKNLKIFKSSTKRKIFLITVNKDSKKLDYLRKKKIKIIFVNRLLIKSDFIQLFKIIKNNGYNRILIETGLTFLNSLLRNRLINNLYIFKSFEKLGKLGINNDTNKIIKKIKITNRIVVNLKDDKLYMAKIR